LLHSNELTLEEDNTWPGYCITHHHHHNSNDDDASQEILLSLLKNSLNLIFTSFIFDSRWNKTSLQLSRIKVLLVLLGSTYYDKESNFKIVDREFLLKENIRLSESVISSALHPSSLITLRQNAIELQQQVLLIKIIFS
jgi:hypothetical protein